MRSVTFRNAGGFFGRHPFPFVSSLLMRPIIADYTATAINCSRTATTRRPNLAHRARFNAHSRAAVSAGRYARVYLSEPRANQPGAEEHKKYPQHQGGAPDKLCYNLIASFLPCEATPSDCYRTVMGAFCTCFDYF